MTWVKCPGSGTSQMLDWDPTEEPAPEMDGKPYPGACICLSCSHGVLVKVGTVCEATSQAGETGLAGALRTHYIQDDDRHSMKYRSPRRSGG